MKIMHVFRLEGDYCGGAAGIVAPNVSVAASILANAFKQEYNGKTERSGPSCHKVKGYDEIGDDWHWNPILEIEVSDNTADGVVFADCHDG